MNQLGDVLVAMYGATIGKTAILSVAGTTNQAVCGCTPFPGLRNTYLLILIKALKRHFVNLGAGGAQPNISREKITATVVGLPPLAEQARIVARVDELMCLCDALEARGRLEAEQHARLLSTLLGTLTDGNNPEALADNWRRVAAHFDLLIDRPEAVDALERAILQWAVRGLLVSQDSSEESATVALARMRDEKGSPTAEGRLRREPIVQPISGDDEAFPLPVGWTWTTLGELVLTSEAGWSPTCLPTPRRPGKWGVLKVSAVSWGDFDPSANKELPGGLEPKKEYEVRQGDFLMSRANTRELVGRSVVVGDTAARLMLSDKIIRLDVSRHVCRAFLNLSNNAVHTRSYYAARTSGTSSSMRNLSREVILASPVALPPYREQVRIIARLNELRHLCGELRQRLLASKSVRTCIADTLVDTAIA